jgi:hypothetical protein
MYFYWKREINTNNMFKKTLNLDEIPSFTEFIKLIPDIDADGWGLSTQFNLLDAKAEDFDIIIKMEEIEVSTLNNRVNTKLPKENLAHFKN